MANSIQLVLEANVDRFNRQMRAGIGAFQGELRRARGSAQSESRQIRQAMEEIGVRPFGEIDQEINRLRSSYNTLARSGQLSAQELNVAHARMQQGIRELEQRKTGWLHAMKEARMGLFALVGAGAGFVAMARNAGRAASEFETRMAEVNTLLGNSQQEIANLSGEVRNLSVALGRDAAENAQALYDIISAGVPEDSAIGTLDVAARAATAGLTETNTAAQLGLSIVNAYGREVDELEEVYDVLFQTVRSGITTFPEISQSMGQVLPVAAAAGVELEQVGAAIAQMTASGVRTPQAMTALRGAITALETPTDSAREAMAELGIEWNGLIGTLGQIRDLDLTAQQLREIVPDQQARTGIQALTNNFDGLLETLREMGDAGGAMADAYEIMADTPEHQLNQFREAVRDLNRELGQLVTSATPVVERLQQVVEAARDMPEPMRQAAGAIASLLALQAAWALGLRRLSTSLKLAMTSAGGLSRVLGRAGVAGAAGWGLTQVLALTNEIMKHHQSMKDAAEAYEEYLEKQHEVMDQTRAHADLQARAAEDLKSATDDEIAEYEKRLRAARNHWRARRNLLARQEAEADPMGPVSEEQRAAARQAEILDQALEDLEENVRGRESLAQLREDLEREHGDRIARIKEEESARIEAALDDQLEKYAAANDRLSEILERRQAILSSWDELIRELGQPARDEDEEPDFLDLVDQLRNAEDLMRQGDLAGAMEQAVGTQDIIRELREAGQVTDAELRRQAERARQISDEIGQAQEEAARENMQNIRETILSLQAEAAALESLQVGFDHEQAVRSVEDLRAEIQERMNEQPLVFPVVTGGNGGGGGPQTAVPGLAGGGSIRGPGTETSDSILARLSNNEFVQPARAVRYYGRDFMEALRNLQVPRFADGGLVGRLPVPKVSQPPRGGAGGGSTPVHLTLDGETFRLSGDADTASRMESKIMRERLKRGRKKS